MLVLLKILFFIACFKINLIQSDPINTEKSIENMANPFSSQDLDPEQMIPMSNLSDDYTPEWLKKAYENKKIGSQEAKSLPPMYEACEFISKRVKDKVMAIMQAPEQQKAFDDYKAKWMIENPNGFIDNMKKFSFNDPAQEASKSLYMDLNRLKSYLETDRQSYLPMQKTPENKFYYNDTITIDGQELPKCWNTSCQKKCQNTLGEDEPPLCMEHIAKSPFMVKNSRENLRWAITQVDLDANPSLKPLKQVVKPNLEINEDSYKLSREQIIVKLLEKYRNFIYKPALEYGCFIIKCEMETPIQGFSTQDGKFGSTNPAFCPYHESIISRRLGTNVFTREFASNLTKDELISAISKYDKENPSLTSTNKTVTQTSKSINPAIENTSTTGKPQINEQKTTLIETAKPKSDSLSRAIQASPQNPKERKIRRARGITR